MAEFEKRRKRIWNRIRDMKNSKDQVIPQRNLDKWARQSLPGEASRSVNLKIKRPSKIKKGDTWSLVHTVVSLVIKQNPELQFIASTEQDNKKSIVIQHCYDYINEKANFKLQNFYTSLSAARFGTGIQEGYYRADRRRIKDIEKYNPETGELKTKEREITEYNDIYWKNRDITTFFPDNRAKDMEDAIDCFTRDVISRDQFDFYYDKKRYKNIDLVKQSKGWFDSENDEYKVDSPFKDYNTEKVEIIKYYNKLRDEKVTYANGVEIEYIPIPYRHKQLPFARNVLFARSAEDFWGIGIPELIESEQATMDTILNIMIDRMKLNLNKPIFSNDLGNDFNDKIELEPGLIIPGDPSMNRELDISPPDKISFDMLEYVSKDSRRQIGMDDPMGGVKSGGTATENAIAKEAGLNRMGEPILMVESIFLERKGRLTVSMIQQFYAEPIRVKKVAGELVEEFRQLPINIQKVKSEMGEYKYEEAQNAYFTPKPSDLMWDGDVKVVANSTLPISRELEVQKIKEGIAISSGSPLVNMLNWAKIGKDFWGNIMRTDGNRYLLEQVTIEEQMKQLAKEENDKMMEGQEIPPTQGATKSHSARHLALLQSKDFGKLDEKIQQIIVAHIKGEEFQQSQKEMQGIGRPVTNNMGVNNAASAQTPLSGVTRQQAGFPNANAAAQPRQQISAIR